MPVISLKHIVSCSSQDKNFPVDNLLKLERYRKWKCKSPGEKQASVIIQFEKSHRISAVDIGNEGSAFIEVLVRNSSDEDGDFKVLLPTSSFMSPSESKSESNINRVRMFDSEKLSKAAVDSKWDVVKIVCTQPFNKYIQYGLSFVNFNSPQEASEAAAAQSSLQLGAFSLKPKDDNSIKPGSLFTKRNEPATPTGPAAIRRASADLQNQTNVTVTPAKQSNSTPEASSSSGKKRSKNDLNDKPAKKKLKHSHDETSDQSSAHVPFDEIMKGVSFVLSGFKNPYRGELREKAVRMGASYFSDWTPAATHLVCAFANTPKYNDVKSKGGHIVKKDWILDCHAKKKLLPWNAYSFIKVEPVQKPAQQDYDDSTDIDTDDEIQRALQQTSAKAVISKREETDNLPLPKLPDAFKNENFFLFGNFDPNQKHWLVRVIVAFGGEVKDYMDQNVDYVVTNSSWDSNFEDALESNSNVKFVKPKWIQLCWEQNAKAAINGFVISKH